jgi:hypothetical protein
MSDSVFFVYPKFRLINEKMRAMSMVFSTFARELKDESHFARDIQEKEDCKTI